MAYRFILSQDEYGMYVAECMDLPRCISQGSTWKAAIKSFMQDFALIDAGLVAAVLVLRMSNPSLQLQMWLNQGPSYNLPSPP